MRRGSRGPRRGRRGLRAGAVRGVLGDERRAAGAGLAARQPADRLSRRIGRRPRRQERPQRADRVDDRAGRHPRADLRGVDADAVSLVGDDRRAVRQGADDHRRQRPSRLPGAVLRHRARPRRVAALRRGGLRAEPGTAPERRGRHAARQQRRGARQAGAQRAAVPRTSLRVARARDRAGAGRDHAGRRPRLPRPPLHAGQLSRGRRRGLSARLRAAGRGRPARGPAGGRPGARVRCRRRASSPASRCWWSRSRRSRRRSPSASRST